MKIIDNKKDYYDYLVGTWGLDEKVVYDRRGSERLWKFRSGYIEECFSTEKRWDDVNEGTPQERYIKAADTYYDFKGRQFGCIIIIGNRVLRFVIDRFLRNDKVVIHPLWVEDKEVKRKDGPAIIVYCWSMKYYGINSISDITVTDIIKKAEAVRNPVFIGTWVPKIIPADAVWIFVYEYLSSLNDKDFVDTRTDKMKIESYGFDNKTSFRNIK